LSLVESLKLAVLPEWCSSPSNRKYHCLSSSSQPFVRSLRRTTNSNPRCYASRYEGHRLVYSYGIGIRIGIGIGIIFGHGHLYSVCTSTEFIAHRVHRQEAICRGSEMVPPRRESHSCERGIMKKTS
jgi:hypothetical protein